MCARCSIDGGASSTVPRDGWSRATRSDDGKLLVCARSGKARVEWGCYYSGANSNNGERERRARATTARAGGGSERAEQRARGGGGERGARSSAASGATPSKERRQHDEGLRPPAASVRLVRFKIENRYKKPKPISSVSHSILANRSFCKPNQPNRNVDFNRLPRLRKRRRQSMALRRGSRCAAPGHGLHMGRSLGFTMKGTKPVGNHGPAHHSDPKPT